MNSFNDKAATWDNNPLHLDRSQAIAAKMLANLKLNDQQIALEYGAGTGILAMLLKDHLKEITLMDNSEEMVNVMQQKVTQGKIHNLKPIFFDLENDQLNDQEFDLIYTQMALHHVIDVYGLLEKFYQLLHVDGNIAIADLYTEDGSFHGKGFEGHLGFDPDELKVKLAGMGFKKINYETCYIISSITESSQVKEFPIFLLIAQK